MCSSDLFPSHDIQTPKTITYNIYIDKHDVPTLGTPIKAQPKADTSEAYDYFNPF